MGMPDLIPHGSSDGQTHLYVDPGVLETQIESMNQEYESLLSSTDEVDPDVFKRVFDSAIHEIDSSFQGIENVESKRHLLTLTRLRRRENQQFEILMHTWASNTIKSSSRPTLAMSFSNLILAGCIEISTIINLVEDVLITANDDTGSIEAADFAELAFQAVELFLNDDDQRLPMNEQVFSSKFVRHLAVSNVHIGVVFSQARACKVSNRKFASFACFISEGDTVLCRGIRYPIGQQITQVDDVDHHDDFLAISCNITFRYPRFRID